MLKRSNLEENTQSEIDKHDLNISGQGTALTLASSLILGLSVTMGIGVQFLWFYGTPIMYAGLGATAALTIASSIAALAISGVVGVMLCYGLYKSTMQEPEGLLKEISQEEERYHDLLKKNAKLMKEDNLNYYDASSERLPPLPDRSREATLHGVVGSLTMTAALFGSIAWPTAALFVGMGAFFSGPIGWGILIGCVVLGVALGAGMGLCKHTNLQRESLKDALKQRNKKIEKSNDELNEKIKNEYQSQNKILKEENQRLKKEKSATPEPQSTKAPPSPHLESRRSSFFPSGQPSSTQDGSISSVQSKKNS